MRTFILAAIAASVALPALSVSTVASAQSYREVRESSREVRRDEHDLRQAQRYGDRRDVQNARRDLRDSRQELREDWRDYRRSNQNAFRRSAYQGPRGYAYRPVAAGHRFDQSYYSGRYQVNDYARYRLPAPRAGHRWVRYGNDVVMVNTRNGRVGQVYRNFFW